MLNNTTHLFRKLLVTGASTACLLGASHGAITLTVYQDGTKVSMSTTGGTIDTTGLVINNTPGSPNNILHGVANVIGFQQSDNSLNFFTGGTLSTTGGFSYGTGGGSGATFTGGYNIIALQDMGGGSLYLATDSIVGINIIPTVTATTIADATIAGLGFVEGSSATLTWGADSMTVQILTVPEPSNLVLSLLGLSTLALRRPRRT